MSGGTINASKFMKRQGIDPFTVYETTVVENYDQRHLCRIQARIKGVFDDIPDGDLPWAIAEYKHPDGAYNKGSNTSCSRPDHSGMIFIPKKGHKVGIRFPTGDAHRPVWTNYTVDDEVKMPEGDPNYPDRVVFKFSNGTYMIIDTKTNEVFLNNPGDVDITVLGDVNTNVIGNQTTTVSDSKGDIPGYLLNAPQTALSLLGQNPTKRIPFIGLLSRGYAGNQHTYVKGDATWKIDGNRKVVIAGNDLLHVGRSRLVTVGLLHRIQCLRSECNG